MSEHASTGIPTPAVISIRTRGTTWVDRQAFLASLIVAPVMALVLIGLTPGGPAHDTLLKVEVFVGLFAGYQLFVVNAYSLRRVDLDASGVTFHYIITKERGAWADLRPSRFPAKHGIWTVVRITRRGFRRGHIVTVEQAQAILRHPSRPHWDLSHAVAASLGLRDSGSITDHGVATPA